MSVTSKRLEQGGGGAGLSPAVDHVTAWEKNIGVARRLEAIHIHRVYLQCVGFYLLPLNSCNRPPVLPRRFILGITVRT